MFSAYLYGKFFNFTRYPDYKKVARSLGDYVIDKNVLECDQEKKTINIKLNGGNGTYEVYLCIENKTFGPIAICLPDVVNLHLTGYAIENDFKLDVSVITVPSKYFHSNEEKTGLTKNSDKTICEFCEQFDNDNLNFCGYCGKKLAETDDQILRNKLKKIFINTPYVYFYSQLDESLKYLFLFPITDLDKKNQENKEKNPNQKDNLELAIGNPERYNPIYGLEMDEVFDLISKLKYDDIYIIDISELELDWCLQKRRLPTCQNSINKSIIFAKIKKINIYTKKEYEEKVCPFLKYCSGWLEKSFYYRGLNEYHIKRCKDVGYTEKFITSNFVPFIKDKIYIISSAYSNFLRPIVEKVAETHIENLGKNNLNFGIEINYRIAKYELSGFNFTPKTIGKVNEKYLPIVIAILNGYKIEWENPNLEDECCICLEKTGEKLECNHPAHKKCIEDSLLRKCPICQCYISLNT